MIELEECLLDVVKEMLRIDNGAVFVVPFNDESGPLFELGLPLSDMFHDISRQVILEAMCCFSIDPA